MINSESQMLSGGAGYEAQVAFYLLLLEIVVVFLVLDPDLGDGGVRTHARTRTRKNSQPQTVSSALKY